MSPRAVTSVHGGVCRQWAFAIVCLFLSAGMVAVLAAAASAQQPQYKEIELNAAFTDDVVQRMQNTLRAFSTARDMSRVEQTERRYAEVYLSQYVPQRITNLDAGGVELAELMSTVLGATSAAERMQAATLPIIVDSLRKGMTPIAGDKGYRPVARVAATMVLGQLNSRPGSNSQLPVPDRNVLGTLFSLYRDQENPEGVRAAALKGLHRHIELSSSNIPDRAKQVIAQEMQSLLDSPVPKTRSPEAHAYLQRFALDMLARIKGPKDQALAKQLVSISTQKERPELIALYAAAKAGTMNEALNGAVETPATVLDQWSLRLLTAVASEIERLESLDPPEAATQQPKAVTEVLAAARRSSSETMSDDDPYGGGADYEAQAIEMGEEEMESEDPYGDPYGGEYSSTSSDEEQSAEVVVARRYLNHVLQQLQLAASGDVKPGIPSKAGGLLAVANDQKQLVETWISRVETLVTNINDESLSDRDAFLDALRQELPGLEEMAADALKDEPQLGLEVDEDLAEQEPADDAEEGSDPNPPTVTEELVGQ